MNTTKTSKIITLKNTLRAAFPATIPVLAGFAVLGMAYGIIMSTKGYGPGWTALFSIFAFCGSMQYLAIPFLWLPFEPLQVFLLALMVNARHLFYSLSFLGKYSGAGKFKFFLIYTLCDETFAIISSVDVPDNVEKNHFYYAVSLLDYSYWIIACTIGNIIGSLITFDTTGLDFALTALFVVLFLEQLKTKTNAVCGIIGVAAAILSIIIFGADNMVIPAMIIIFVSLLTGRSKLCD